MATYSNYKVWKDVDLYQDAREYLQEHEEYTAEDVYSICKRLIKVAQEYGLEGCYLKFNSHVEPYEDYLGTPSVTACGYRKLSTKELKEQEQQGFVQKKADELGITFYEANVVVQLQDRGVI